MEHEGVREDRVANENGAPAAKGKAARRKGAAAEGKGLTIPRFFTREGEHPFDSVRWERRTATIQNERGEMIFEQRDLEIPADWSQLATNVVASKYFRGHLGSPDREHSVKQLVGRVVGRIGEWGRKAHYFDEVPSQQSSALDVHAPP